MRTAVILNPAAGNGRAGALQQKLASLFAASGLSVEILFSQSGSHATKLAKEAAAWADLVVAVGGDGTIHHVANGIVLSKKPVALGLIPVGTGNDFVKMTGIPVHIESAIKILAKGKRKAVDYGTVTYQSARDQRARCFFNTLGIGFDAAVGDRASSFKALPGFGAYLAALLNTLFTLQYADVTVTCDGEDRTPFFSGQMLLSSVGNGSTSGGMFKLTPHASIDDGWFDVCVIERISIPRLLASVPRVLRGRHTNMKEYRATTATRILIEVLDTMNRVGKKGGGGLPVHADGEILAPDVRRLDVQLIEKGISVIVP
ncbi:MAG: diacylglycerol kinase family protein [Bacteroidota bacterium]